MSGAAAGQDGRVLRRNCLIGNRLGLHARAAARFVKTASRFDAEIAVTCGGTRVLGTSILGLMMLAAAPGSEIEIEATGSEAQEALDALTALVDRRFDED